MTRTRRDANPSDAEIVRYRAGEDDEAQLRPDGPRRRGVVHHLGLESRGAARRHRADLITSVFETAIVPEMARRHGRDGEQPDPIAVGNPITPEDRARLTMLARDNDLAGCIAAVDALVSRGISFTDICLDALGHAAAELGQMWTDDRCSFVEVTAGLGILHLLLERLSASFLANIPVRNASRRILLASLSGEQHSLGLTILGDLFRQSGWDVTMELAAAQADISATVRNGWFAIVGLSVAADERTPLLAGTIDEIRKASVNPYVGVMVGGQALLQHPELAERIGADISACNAAEAVLRAEGLRLLLDHGTERRLPAAGV